MPPDSDGYGARPGQNDIDRLLEDARTLSPAGVERAAEGWRKHTGSGAHEAWHQAEREGLHVIEKRLRTQEWDELRGRILGLTERSGALISWRAEHGQVGHEAESALLGAALGLMARPDLDRAHTHALLAPMAEALPWLDEAVHGGLAG